MESYFYFRHNTSEISYFMIIPTSFINKVASLFILIGIFLVHGCSIESIEFKEISVPAAKSSVFPFLTNDDNFLYLSWIETIHDTIDILKVARGNEEGFGYVTEVARGDDWFVNWADFPKVSTFDSSTYITHWLKKSTSSTYDYNVHIGIGSFGTSNPDTSFIIHEDGVNAEHGFVSYEPYGKRMMVAWLDGRNTKNPDGSYGQMTLRAAILNKGGSKSNEWEIDDMVCDCCQTDFTLMQEDVMLAYRDRDEKETRDNYFSVFNGDKWTEGQAIYDDGWTIAGCPVNGPAIHSGYGGMAVAWYSEAEGSPGIYFSWYNHDKRNFNTPDWSRLGDNIKGRLDVKVVDSDHAAILWLEQEEDIGKLMLGIFSKEYKMIKEYVVDYVNPGRSSGFGHLSVLKGVIYIAYTASGSYEGIKMKSLSLEFLPY